MSRLQPIKCVPSASNKILFEVLWNSVLIPLSTIVVGWWLALLIDETGITREITDMSQVTVENQTEKCSGDGH